MKLTVTRTQMLNLINIAFGSRTDCTITDFAVLDDVVQGFLERQKQFSSGVELMNRIHALMVSEGLPKDWKYRPAGKIAAIKRLRELFGGPNPRIWKDGDTGITLVCAKYSVENWDRFEQYVCRYNKLPIDWRTDLGQHYPV